MAPVVTQAYLSQKILQSPPVLSHTGPLTLQGEQENSKTVQESHVASIALTPEAETTVPHKENYWPGFLVNRNAKFLYLLRDAFINKVSVRCLSTRTRVQFPEPGLEGV